MSSAPIIVAAACSFPSGPLIELADAAVRVQLSLQRRHPLYVDSAGVAAKASFFPFDKTFDIERWVILLRNALEQLAGKLQNEGVSAETHAHYLWLVLPDPAARFGMPANLIERMREAANQQSFLWQRVEIVTGGHAAGVSALTQAADTLSAKPNALAIVLGVESGLSAEALMWLDMQSLLHGVHRPDKGGFRTEAYGRIPGEGAAALALVARGSTTTSGWAKLLGCGTAAEPVTHSVAKPCTGGGLTQAAQFVLKQGSQHTTERIGCITADLNGEPYRADQFGFTALRLAGALQPNWQRVTPALASGDLGAASSVAHVALAAYAMRQRPQNPTHLILASSDDTLRGAVLLGPINPVANPMEVRSWRSPSTSMG